MSNQLTCGFWKPHMYYEWDEWWVRHGNIKIAAPTIKQAYQDYLNILENYKIIP